MTASTQHGGHYKVRDNSHNETSLERIDEEEVDHLN